MASFPRATGMTRGYSRPQVDHFLARVAQALDGAPDTGTGEAPVTAAEIRRTGFDLLRGGYDVTAVDAHLDVLELRALALERRIGASPAPTGSDSSALAGSLEQLLDLVEAAPGRRFARVTRLRRGYAAREVDAFLERLSPAVIAAQHAAPAAPEQQMDADAVRRAVFHVRFGGYDEGAVDDALDLAVDVLLRRERIDAAPDTHPGAHTASARAAAADEETVVLDRRVHRVS